MSGNQGVKKRYNPLLDEKNWQVTTKSCSLCLQQFTHRQRKGKYYTPPAPNECAECESLLEFIHRFNNPFSSRTIEEEYRHRFHPYCRIMIVFNLSHIKDQEPDELSSTDDFGFYPLINTISLDEFEQGTISCNHPEIVKYYSFPDQEHEDGTITVHRLIRIELTKYKDEY